MDDADAPRSLDDGDDAEPVRTSKPCKGCHAAKGVSEDDDESDAPPQGLSDRDADTAGVTPKTETILVDALRFIIKDRRRVRAFSKEFGFTIEDIDLYVKGMAA